MTGEWSVLCHRVTEHAEWVCGSDCSLSLNWNLSELSLNLNLKRQSLTQSVWQHLSLLSCQRILSWLGLGLCICINFNLLLKQHLLILSLCTVCRLCLWLCYDHLLILALWLCYDYVEYQARGGGRGWSELKTVFKVKVERLVSQTQSHSLSHTQHSHCDVTESEWDCPGSECQSECHRLSHWH